MEKYIDKIIIKKGRVDDSYILNIKYKNDITNTTILKKNIYIFAIDICGIKSKYIKLLRTIIFNNINLNINYVFIIERVNGSSSKYPYKFIRLTYDNFFTLLDKPFEFTLKSLFEFIISKDEKGNQNIINILRESNNINFKKIEKINIFTFLQITHTISDFLDPSITKLDLDKRIIINGIISNKEITTIKLNDFLKNLNVIGTFIYIDDTTEYSNAVLKETIYMFISIFDPEKNNYIIKKNHINLKNNLLFFNENSMNDKNYFLKNENDYYLIYCKNKNVIEDNAEIIINDKVFNIHFENELIKKNDTKLIIECILKEIRVFNIDNNYTIYEYYNILIKLINNYKYINKFFINNKKGIYLIYTCSLIYEIIDKAISICSKKKKHEINMLNILKVIKKQSTSFIRLKNKNFCIYIERIFKNILNIYEDDLKNNNLCNSILNNIDDNKKFTESCDFFTSLISFTNWYEDIETDNCTCLILNICGSKISKLGYGANISIINITSTFYPCNDYIELCDNFFTTSKEISDGLIFKGNAIGDGNCVIPLYINKNHWNIAKKKMKYLLGIIMSNNPAGFVKYHYRFVYKLFLDYCNTITIQEKSGVYLTNKYLSCFWSYFRTVAQISFDNNYNRGIYNVVKQYLQNPKKRVLKNEYDYITMLGQIISTGYIIDDGDIKKIIGHIINEIIKSNIKKGDNSYLLECITKNKNVFSYVNELIIIHSNNLNRHIPYLFSFYIFNRILKKFYLKFKNYSNFIKILDNNYGLMPEKYNIEFKKMLLEELDIYGTDISIKTIYGILYRTRKDNLDNIYKLILLDNILKNINFKMRNTYEFPLDNISSILIFNILEQYKEIEDKNKKNKGDTERNIKVEINTNVIDGLAGAGGRL